MDAHAWDARYRAAEHVWPTGPNAWVARETAGLSSGLALDLAAGEGRNALWLAQRGWTVDAVDFSPVAARRIAESAVRHSAPVRVTVADVRRWAPTADSYDLVLISYLHLPRAEMARVLESAALAARPGGTLLLVGHDVSNLEHGIGGPQEPEVLSSVERVLAVWEPLTDVVVAEVARRPAAGEVALDTVVRAVRH